MNEISREGTQCWSLLDQLRCASLIAVPGAFGSMATDANAQCSWYPPTEPCWFQSLARAR
jgi:hypothetical protein